MNDERVLDLVSYTKEGAEEMVNHISDQKVNEIIRRTTELIEQLNLLQCNLTVIVKERQTQ